jgi:hypothetical protein
MLIIIIILIKEFSGFHWIPEGSVIHKTTEDGEDPFDLLDQERMIPEPLKLSFLFL